MATEQELSDFLRSVERRAFKRTAYAVRDDDSALDIVQDAMIRLAEHYADRAAAELPMIFARILSNATIDWFRRQKTRQAVLQNFSDLQAGADDDPAELLDALAAIRDELQATSPVERLSRAQTLALIEFEVAVLPARQREAFLLRYWEDLDVAETAAVMGCTTGSVKTHCFRAVQALAAALAAKGLKP